MNDYQKTFGSHVRRLRKQKKLTQEKLAENSALSERYISEIERGIANPRLTALKELAEGLGISVADLFVFEAGLVNAAEIRERLLALLQSAEDDSLESLYLTFLSALTTQGKSR